MIFFNYPKSIYLKYKNEINKSIDKVLKSGVYVKSTELKNFETSFAKYIGSKFASGVGNATDAIYISLKTIGIKKNDEVITVSHTATGTAMAILNTGAKIVFCDINKNNFNIDLSLLEKKININTKAIVVVHIYGQSCNMNDLLKISKKYNLPIIEDCSQSAGGMYDNKKLGSFGLFGCFSFFPTKNLSCIGDGGMITCNKLSFKKYIDSMREYGWNSDRDAITVGINSRLDEIQASILNVKLKYLDKDNLERRQIANFYDSKIINKKIIKPEENFLSYHVYHLYVIKLANRDKLIKELNKKNIFPGIHYKKAIHQQKIFSNHKHKLPSTNNVVKLILSLPIYPGLSKKDLVIIINIINKF